MTKPDLTSPEYLFFASHKYVPIQFSVIPYESDWLLAVSYDSHRTYNGRFTDEELLSFLRTSYEKQKRAADRAAQQSRDAAQQRQALNDLDLDLDLTGLDLPNLDLKL